MRYALGTLAPGLAALAMAAAGDGAGIARPRTYRCGTELKTAAEIAASRGIGLEALARLGEAGRLMPEDLCVVPDGVLDRALRRLQQRPDQPDAAMRQRRRSLQDERGRIAPDGLMQARRHVEAMRRHAERFGLHAAGIEPGLWSWLGPGNVGGRVRALLVHPTTPTTLWAGGVAGGVWKTTDGGASWRPLDDFMANLAVTSLVLDPRDPGVIYAGTGEGTFNGDAIQGAGIFRSADGGNTWTRLAATAGDSRFHFVNRLAFSPDGSVLLAATRAGIQRSLDGGASFLSVAGGNVLDVDFHPTDGARAVASGFFGLTLFSTNGGASWQAAGVPAGAARVEVAYARSQPQVVYASADRRSGEIWKSTDGGASYAVVNTGGQYLGGQGWYDNALWVDPTNPDVAIVGGIDLWRTMDGGATLTRISSWFDAPRSAHADHHVIVAHPAFDGAGQKTVYFGNDGGVYRADDVYAVGATGWQALNNNLGITQFYGGAGNLASGAVFGGTQDNGTLLYAPGVGTGGWTPMFGADGGYCAADPLDSRYLYGETQWLGVFRSSDGGETVDFIIGGLGDSVGCSAFIAPILLDPNDPQTLLAGGCSLWRTQDARAPFPEWTVMKPALPAMDVVTAIAVAEGHSDFVWVARGAAVFKTENGTAAEPAWVQVGQGRLPARGVTRITVDRTQPAVVYLTYGGFTADNVWRTTDGGTTWSPLGGAGAGALPAVPVRSLVVHPQNTAWLYVGTEVGIFTSTDGGASWVAPQDGPANVSVDELFWMGSHLVAVTHGRGIFRVPVAPAGQAVTLSWEIAESNVGEGPGPVVLRVRVETAGSLPLAGSASVSYSTADGSAQAGQDYVASAGTLTFPAGTPSGAAASVSLTLVDDASAELPETFALNLAGAVGGVAAAPTRHTVTLLDDDFVPVLDIYDLTVTEGHAGTLAAPFEVTLLPASGRTVSVSYATRPSTATEGQDYTPVLGTLTFAPGTTSQVIPVPILGDTAYEPMEYFWVDLADPVNAGLRSAQALGRIRNDDPYPAGSGDGLMGTYYDEIDFQGASVTRVDPVVDFAFGTGPPHPAIGPDTFSVVWTGRLEPRYDEQYTFYVESDEGVRLWLNDQVVIDKLTDQIRTEWSGHASLVAGVKYDLRLEYYERAGEASVRLRWASFSTPKAVIPTAQLHSLSLEAGDASAVEGDGGAVLSFPVRLSAPSTQPVTVRYATDHGTAGRRRFAAAGTLITPELGPATPYPSTVSLAGVPGTVTAVRVTLLGLSHTFPGDLDLLLVGPGGQSAVLMSDVGGFNPVTDAQVSFEAGAPRWVPLGRLPSGRYRPLNYGPWDDYPPPAPPGVPGDDLGVFAGTDPSGVWSLYVMDDDTPFGNPGTLGGWRLEVQTEEDYVGASGEVVFSPGQTLRTVEVPILGDTEGEADETLFLNLHSPVSAAIRDHQGVGTILDDDGGIRTRYYPLTPCRLVDTRGPSGAAGGPALLASATRLFPAAGRCGVPEDARAVAVNVTVTGATAGGNLRVFQGEEAVPLASTINFAAGRARANNAVVALGASGWFGVRADLPAPATVHLVCDVYGYFK